MRDKSKAPALLSPSPSDCVLSSIMTIPLTKIIQMIPKMTAQEIWIGTPHRSQNKSIPVQKALLENPKRPHDADRFDRQFLLNDTEHPVGFVNKTPCPYERERYKNSRGKWLSILHHLLPQFGSQYQNDALCK